MQAPGFLTATRRVEIAEGATLTVEFLLDAGASVEGIVVEREGHPIPHAMVSVGPKRLNASRGEWLLGDREAKSGDDGRFVVEGLPSEDIVLVARSRNHEERESGTGPPLRVAPNARDVRVVLHPLASARLRLIQPAGAPFVGSVETMITTGSMGSGGSEASSDGGVPDEGEEKTYDSYDEEAWIIPGSGGSSWSTMSPAAVGSAGGATRRQART